MLSLLVDSVQPIVDRSQELHVLNVRGVLERSFMRCFLTIGRSCSVLDVRLTRFVESKRHLRGIRPLV